MSLIENRRPSTLSSESWNYRYRTLLSGFFSAFIFIMLGLAGLYGSDEGFHFRIEMVEDLKQAAGPKIWRPLADGINEKIPLLLPLAGLSFLIIGIYLIIPIIRLLIDRATRNTSRLILDNEGLQFISPRYRRKRISWIDCVCIKKITIGRHQILQLSDASGRKIYVWPKHFDRLELDILYEYAYPKLLSGLSRPPSKVTPERKTL